MHFHHIYIDHFTTVLIYSQNLETIFKGHLIANKLGLQELKKSKCLAGHLHSNQWNHYFQLAGKRLISAHTQDFSKFISQFTSGIEAFGTHTMVGRNRMDIIKLAKREPYIHLCIIVSNETKQYDCHIYTINSFLCTNTFILTKFTLKKKYYEFPLSFSFSSRSYI